MDGGPNVGPEASLDAALPPLFSDAGIVWMQGFTKRRDLPPGLARVLSRTSKQSTETLEAEFDALKERGTEVEALLELPIEEARRARPAPHAKPG